MKAEASSPDAIARLGELLQRLRPWLDQRRGLGDAALAEHEGGDAYMVVDPASTAKAASFNENRVYLGGQHSSLQRDALERWVARYRAAAVPRFFVWLSPGPQAPQVARWLEQDGFEPVEWTRYPVLVWRADTGHTPKTALQVSEVDATRAAAARDRLGVAMSRDCAATIGQPGMRHFMAFADGVPVAVAALAHFEDLGYLAYAGTASEWQGRGAQQALIAVRLAAARAMGCQVIASETLTMLPHSYANLQRLGFVEAFDKRVYGYQF